MKIHLSKGKEERDLIHFAFDNAANFYKQQSELRVGRVELEMLKDTLSLETIPKRMECIDISNTGGSTVVASNVCFIGGSQQNNSIESTMLKVSTVDKTILPV